MPSNPNFYRLKRWNFMISVLILDLKAYVKYLNQKNFMHNQLQVLYLLENFLSNVASKLASGSVFSNCFTRLVS